MLTCYFHLLNGLISIEDSVLVSTAFNVIHLLQITHDEENFLEWVAFALVLKKNAIGPLTIKLDIISFICLVWYRKLSFLEFDVSVNFSPVYLLQYQIINLCPEDRLL